MNEAIAQQAMGRYAEAACRDAGLEAIILFGSRARGTARRDSDWDLCIVGGRSEPEAVAGVEKSIPEDAVGEDIDMLWAPDPVTLEARASAGTVWAHIVAEGTVLAGEEDMLEQMQIKPMKPETVRYRLNIIMGKIGQAARELDARPNEDDWQRTQRMWIGTESTTHAAEALTWLLAGFAGVKHHDQRHQITRCAEAAHKRAQAAGETTRIGRTLETLAQRISAINGASAKGRKILYDDRYIEDQNTWERRLVEVLRGTRQLIEGCVAGEGPLHELRDEATRAGLTAVLIVEIARIADEAEEWMTRSHRPGQGAWIKIAQFARSMRATADERQG